MCEMLSIIIYLIILISLFFLGCYLFRIFIQISSAKFDMSKLNLKGFDVVITGPTSGLHKFIFLFWANFKFSNTIFY